MSSEEEVDEPQPKETDYEIEMPKMSNTPLIL